MKIASLSLPACAAVLLLLPAAAAADESCTLLGFLDSWARECLPADLHPYGNAAPRPASVDASTSPAAPARITVSMAGEFVPIAQGPRIRIPVPPRIPSPPGIPVPGVGIGHRGYFPGYKSPSSAWLLSFLIPGLGQFYVGGHTGAIMGAIHMGLFATAITGMLIFQESDEDVMLACAAVAVLDWLVGWIEAPILAVVHNRWAYSVGMCVDYDPDTRSVGAGLRLKF
jgi:hypothetical protein